MSVEPWMVAWPRSAMMPPPGRPMLPSSSWTIAAVRMILRADACAGSSPRRTRSAVVRSRPVFSVTASRDLLGSRPAEMPHASADHLGGVARVVPLEDLEDAARVLQRLVAHDPGVLQRRAARAVLVAGRALGLAVSVLVGGSWAADRARSTRRRPRWRRPSSSGRSCRAPRSKPENSPSRSSVSRNSSLTSRRRVRVGDDVLLEVQLVAEDVVDQRAEERRCRCRPGSGCACRQVAEVRVNRGSTWMTLAPLRFASITHW